MHVEEFTLVVEATVFVNDVVVHLGAQLICSKLHGLISTISAALHKYNYTVEI